MSLHPTAVATDVSAPDLKPRLRGWIHAVSFPVVVVAGIILAVHAPATAPRVSVLIFMVTASLMFGTSAVYHLGNWSPTAKAWLRRADHSNIFLIIAGTYTPLTVMLLEKKTSVILLSIVWVGAILGMGSRMIWLRAPRWVYTPVYLALGWVAVGFMGKFYETGGAAVVVPLAIGGLAYTGGAVIYALKRPNPIPGWFGFHEIFHVGTAIGFWCTFGSVVAAINLI